MPGLDQLLRRLAAARDDLLAQHRLGDVLADVRQELDEIVAQERRGIERRLTSASGAPRGLDELAADLATRRQEQLAALPDDLGGRIRGLSDYDFLEPDARRRFDELMDTLRRQVLDAHFEGLADAIRDATPEQLAANREMVRELNGLLQERLAGGDPDVSRISVALRRPLPGRADARRHHRPARQRMAAMQSLMARSAPISGASCRK